jgi:hypothetical protein
MDLPLDTIKEKVAYKNGSVNSAFDELSSSLSKT